MAGKPSNRTTIDWCGGWRLGSRKFCVQIRTSRSNNQSIKGPIIVELEYRTQFSTPNPVTLVNQYYARANNKNDRRGNPSTKKHHTQKCQYRNSEWRICISDWKSRKRKKFFPENIICRTSFWIWKCRSRRLSIKKNQEITNPLLRRKCGIVFQDFKLLIDRNVYENLAFVLRATGWKTKKPQRRIETVLPK